MLTRNHLSPLAPRACYALGPVERCRTIFNVTERFPSWGLLRRANVRCPKLLRLLQFLRALWHMMPPTVANCNTCSAPTTHRHEDIESISFKHVLRMGGRQHRPLQNSALSAGQTNGCMQMFNVATEKMWVSCFRRPPIPTTSHQIAQARTYHSPRCHVTEICTLRTTEQSPPFVNSSIKWSKD